MSKEVVSRFFAAVRTREHVDHARDLMAPRVLAHQMTGELPAPVIARTPDEYIAHVAELDAYHGGSDIEIQELLAEGDKVYVRWVQRGERATSVASAVYRVEDGRITEYWIQTRA